MIYNLFSREIQHQLISCMNRIPSRNSKCPVRMFSVQITVFRDHLRLHPDSEFYTQIIDLLYQISQCPPKLSLIDKPVPETAVIIITFSKPAVIQHQHVNACMLCLFCQFV